MCCLPGHNETCARLTWVHHARHLVVETTIKGQPSVSGFLSLKEPTLCHSIFMAHACISIGEFSVTRWGASGCPRFTASAFGYEAVNHTFQCLTFISPVHEL